MQFSLTNALFISEVLLKPIKNKALHRNTRTKLEVMFMKHYDNILNTSFQFQYPNLQKNQ